MKYQTYELVIQLIATLLIVGAVAYILLAPHLGVMLDALRGGARLLP